MKLSKIAGWYRHRLSFCLKPHQAYTLLQRTLATTSSKNTSAIPTINTNNLVEERASIPASIDTSLDQYPSPLPECALRSAKLVALHARLALSKRLPLQTLARTLVDPSADPNPNFNNAALARLGKTLISYHVGEYLICKYPRLPIDVLFAASYAYNGPKTMQLIAQEWGIETAAAPGSEVDPGLLQFSKVKPGTSTQIDGASRRPDVKNYFRRGITSRLVYDDEFGDKVSDVSDITTPIQTDLAYASFVSAVVGALYVHAGRQSAKNFIKQVILSRYLDVSTLFQFCNPIRELTRLCNREWFDLPVARIISETGRWSRAPVFLVGIYSGKDLLGTGYGPSLPEARIKGCVAALKSWYLYSPGNNLRVPSDTEDQSDDKKWEPVYIDPGEIVLS